MKDNFKMRKISSRGKMTSGCAGEFTPLRLLSWDAGMPHHQVESSPHPPGEESCLGSDMNQILLIEYAFMVCPI